MAEPFPTFLEALGLIPKALKRKRKRPLYLLPLLSLHTVNCLLCHYQKTGGILKHPVSPAGFSNCTHPSERTSLRAGALPSVRVLFTIPRIVKNAMGMGVGAGEREEEREGNCAWQVK